MSLDVRPLTLGELLDRSFSLYRRHFWLFVGIMALPSVFTLILTVGMLVFPRMIGSPDLAFEDADPLRAALTVAAGAVTIVLAMIAYWIAYMVALGATTVAVSDLYVGRTATIAGSYARLQGQVWRLLLLLVLLGVRLTALLIGLLAVVAVAAMLTAFAVGSGPAGTFASGLVFVVGFVLAVLAWTILALRYAVCVPSLVLENVTAGGSIRRSVALTRGGRWRAGVLVLFATVITYAAMIIFQGPFTVGAMVVGPDTTTGFWLQLVGAVTGTFGGAIAGPLMIIALALLYYDFRIRKEALDLELMLAGLDADPSSAQA